MQTLYKPLLASIPKRYWSTTSHQKKLTAVWLACVWPETRSSAAGLRSWALVNALHQDGWDITYISPAKSNHFTKELENLSNVPGAIKTAQFHANDSKFDAFVGDVKPDVVIFDRFVLEEQFSWRVRNFSPDSVLVVDTQDLHFLRSSRRQLSLKGENIQSVVNHVPSLQESIGDEILRELSSIHRSDHTFLVSPYEQQILINHYQIPPDKLSIASFFYDTKEMNDRRTKLPSYNNRRNFVMIGNFRHLPNVDQLKWVCKSLWPRIRNRIQSHPDAELHIYGAYPEKQHMELTDRDAGIIVKGPVKDQYNSLRKYRVNLAPLRFGAGIKGKIADGFFVGTPCVTTQIGCEGMTVSDDCSNWGGFVVPEDKRVMMEDSQLEEQLIDRAVELYDQEEVWNSKQLSGFKVMEQLFDEKNNANEFVHQLKSIVKHKSEIRNRNYLGQMLWYNSNRSTEYFSKYIETKNELLSMKIKK